MVAKGIVGVGMHEQIERTVIECQPSHEFRKVRRLKGNLIAPLWVRANKALMKAAHVHDVSKARKHLFAKGKGGISAGRIEVHVGMPAGDGGYIETVHDWL